MATPSKSGAEPPSTDLPLDLRRTAIRRLSLLAAIVVVATLVEGVISHAIESRSTPDYPTRAQVWDLVGVGAMIAVSSAAFLVLRHESKATKAQHAFGVGYLLCLALLLSLTDHADYFWKGGHQLHGIPVVAALMLMFPVIVPMRATSALVIALGMAATGPISLHALSATLAYERPSFGAVIGSFPFIMAGLSAVLARIVHQLGIRLKEARQLGSYTLIEKLGEGGMGVVYRAQHAMLRRPTAVKVLKPDRLSEEAVARFEREVQLTALLTHPNTVTVFDYGRAPDGTFYYAMQLLDGATLSDVVDIDGAQPVARVVSIMRQVADALTEAHERGLIHRDVKPSNVMLVEQGGKPDVAKVLDFGLVREVNAPDGTVTRADTITGTPQYLAPEAIKDSDLVGPPADLYALGAVGYFLVTGRHVFDGASVVELCAAHLHEQPLPPSERLGKPVPECVERLLLECLAKNPAERPASARALSERLRDCPLDGTWTDDDARSWWAAHADAIAEKRSREMRGAMGRTLEVAR